MSLQCFSPLFGSQFGMKYRLKNFKMAAMAATLDSRMQWFYQFWNSYVPPMLSIKFRLNPTYGLGGDVVWRIWRWPPWLGGHLGYRNGMSLAILNLCVAQMPPIKFWLNLTWFGRRCYLKNFKIATGHLSRWPPAILDIWTNDFRNSESPCCHNASHKVSAQSNIWFWRRCKKCEKLTMDDGQQAIEKLQVS